MSTFMISTTLLLPKTEEPKKRYVYLMMGSNESGNIKKKYNWTANYKDGLSFENEDELKIFWETAVSRDLIDFTGVDQNNISKRKVIFKDAGYLSTPDTKFVEGAFGRKVPETKFKMMTDSERTAFIMHSNPI